MVDIVNAGSIKFDEPQNNIVDAGSIKFDEPESNIVDAGSIKFDEPAAVDNRTASAMAFKNKYDSHMATLSQGPSSELTLKSAPELARQWGSEFVTSALFDIGTWPHKKVMSWLESMQPKDVPEGYIAKGKYKADLIKNGEWSKALSVSLLDTAKTTPLGLFAKPDKNIELSGLGKTSAEFAGLTVPIGGGAKVIEMGALKLAKLGVPKYLVPLARLTAWAGFGTAESYSKQLFKEADSLQKIIEGQKDISNKDAIFNGMMYATGEAVIGSVVHGWRIRKSINELSKLTGRPTVDILHENLHYGKTGELLKSLTDEVVNQKKIKIDAIINAVEKTKAEELFASRTNFINAINNIKDGKAKAEELAKSLDEQLKSAKASAQVFEQSGVGTGKQLISDVERHKQFLKGQALENDATIEFIGNTKVPDIFSIKTPEDAFYIGQALSKDQYQSIISKYEGKLAGDVIPGYGPKLTSPKEMRPGVGKAIQNLKALRDGYEGRTPVFKRPPGDIKKEFTPEYGQPSKAKFIPDEEMPPMAEKPSIPKEVPVAPIKPPIEVPVAPVTATEAPTKTSVRSKPAPDIGLTGEKGVPKYHKDLMEYLELDPERTYDKTSSKEIATLISGMMKEDPDRITKIAFGELPLPNGMRLGHIVKAVELRAKEAGDVATLRRLASSDYINKAATEAGKTLQAFDNQVPDDSDPVKSIWLLNKIKEENVVKKLRGKNKGKTVDNLVSEEMASLENEIKKEAKKQNPNTLSNYLKGLEC